LLYSDNVEAVKLCRIELSKNGTYA